MPYSTREGWLQAATEKLTSLILEHEPGFEPPRVSVGFAPTAGRQHIGWCFAGACASDGRRQIYISPVLDPQDLAAPQGVLATLLHEMCHAALPDEVGHKGEFPRLARAVGLEKPWTATTASAPLQARLQGIALDLGPFPHAAIDMTRTGREKQSTRMVKCECAQCGYVARTTKKWLDARGAPLCPCNTEPMLAADVDLEVGR